MSVKPPASDNDKVTTWYRTLLDEWSALSLYERFEQAVVHVLTGIIAIIILIAVWNLVRDVTLNLLFGALNPLEHVVFQGIFGMIFTVVIALEFKRSLLIVAERKFGVLQVRSIVLIGILAIVRKLIIMDLTTASPAKIAALGGVVLALGMVFWLVRDQDRKENQDM